MTSDQWKNFTIPWDDESDSFSSCEQYEITWEEGEAHHTNVTEKCSSWTYDRSLMRETVATTNDWVCDQAKYSVHIMSITIVGTSLSTLVLPVIADKYTGRRPMFFIAISIHAVFSVLVIFTNNFAAHLVFRFLAAWSFQTNYQTCYMIALEFLPPEQRNLAAFLSFVSWAAGACSVSLLSWLLADWSYIVWSLIAIDFLMWGLWRYLPESPRWLLTKDKIPEAASILMEVAETNNVKDRMNKNELIKYLENIENPIEDEVSLTKIIKYPKFCIRVSLLFITSGAVFLGFGIVGLNINVLPNRIFMNFFLLSLIEVPSNICSSICVQYLGRRFTAFMCYFVCIFVSFLAALLVEHKIVLLILVGILKFALTMGVYIIYLQVTEITPTTIRSTGFGVVAVFGTATLSVVPYIIDSNVDVALNYWVILAVSILCAICTIPIPETLGLPLPQTLFEANKLGNNRPLHKWVHHWNLAQYSDPVDSKVEDQRHNLPEVLENTPEAEKML